MYIKSTGTEKISRTTSSSARTVNNLFIYVFHGVQGILILVIDVVGDTLGKLVPKLVAQIVVVAPILGE